MNCSRSLACLALWMVVGTPGAVPIQESSAKPRGLEEGPEAKTSVVVNGDRSLTFSFTSKEAENVEIGGDLRLGRELVGPFAVKSVPMKRSADTVWTYTSEPALPSIYRYFFVVDGTTMPARKIKVDGPEDMPWDLRPDIPHGTVVIEKFRSEVLKGVIPYLGGVAASDGPVARCAIYLPPSYGSTKKKYPVLYLLHSGASDEEGGNHLEWVSKGFADNILDSLIASGKAKEMILVMPDRALWTAKEKKQLLSASGKDLEVLWEALNERSHRYVIDEVMPFVASRYRLSGEIAVAGLSGGGGESLHLMTSNPETFIAAGVLSGSGGMIQSDDHEPYGTIMRNELAAAKPKLGRVKLLYLACGDYDPHLDSMRTMHAMLDDLKIHHVFVESEGGHEWPFWSRSLVDFASRLSQVL
jgi:enterochelin esterase-like enzyme